MTIQHTLILIKPDAIERKLIGEIISYFERAGFSIIKLKKGRMSRELAVKQYRATESQLTAMGKRTLEATTASGGLAEVMKRFGTTDPYKLGEKIIEWTRTFMTSSDIIAMILEREDAVLKAREIIGKTDPSVAAKGSIRGDFGEDSLLKANLEKRPVKNLVHASDEEGAEIETSLFEKEFF